MKNLNRRRILSFLGFAPAIAVVPTGAEAQTAAPIDLGAMTFDELRHLWNEHRSLAQKSIQAMNRGGSWGMITAKRRATLVADAKRHDVRAIEVYRYAKEKFGDILPRSGHYDVQTGECAEYPEAQYWLDNKPLANFPQDDIPDHQWPVRNK